jgi:transcription factor SPT20
VHDYRSGGVKPKDESASADGIKVETFSIHNYNSFITPSPHVPYPSKVVAKPSQADGQSRAVEVKEDKDLDKENMPAPGQPASQKQPKVKVITVVLFPTALSHSTDIQLLATTPVPDMQTFRRNQASGRTGGNPPTPLTSVPPTPTLSRSPKRQKMAIDGDNVHEFESEFYNATCPKLYLEPTKNLAESVALIEAMSHPNNQNPAPPRKSRKRTTAELAADEAEAADMQSFMLAGDEWQATKAGTATGGDEGQSGGHGANARTFSRFKTLATIKMNHEEAERRKKEQEAAVAQAKRQAQAESEAQKRRDLDATRLAEQSAAMMQHRQEQQLRQQQQQAHIQNDNIIRANHAQPMINPSQGQSQTPLSATHPHFSSPVIRQGTPHSATSPLMNGHVSHPLGGTPMVATSSNHGAGSPARPPSAMSHNPSQNMARTISQQNRSMSRNGTPQMIQGTPVMNPAIPSRTMASTPQPRMNNQGSPTPGMQGGTPIMIQGTPQSGQQGMTQEQMQQMAQMQQLHLQQQARARAMHQGGMQVPPGQNNTTPQQLALHKARLHIQREGVPQGQNPATYTNLIASKFFQQIQTQQAQAQQQAQQQLMAANMSPQNLAQGGMGVAHPGVPNQGGLNIGNMSLQQLQQQYMTRKQQLIQTYGSVQAVPQQHMQPMRQLEMAMRQRDQQTQAAQAAQAQAQGGQMHMNPGMNQMGMQQAGGAQNMGQVQQQQYQQMLQAQRTNQARQQQMLAMRQQQMNAAGGQMPQNMGNMGQMGMGQMGGQNMGQMGGMNMQQMQMQNGMQGMGGVPMNQMNPQQQQQMQMMLMRQAQAQAQMRAGQQQQQQRPQGDGGMEWSGV